jgi:ABC-type transport system substrate-binding protein
MENQRSIYRDQFNLFAHFFTAMVSIGIAVYAIYIAGGVEAMTQPLPTVVLVAFGLAFLAAVLAFISWWNMHRTPKDKRLDQLIDKVNNLPDNETTQELITAIQQLTEELRKDKK